MFEVHYSKSKSAKRQPYCGPSAISALTGVTVQRAAAEINRTLGLRPGKAVKGVCIGTMYRALRRLGYAALPYAAVEGGTVARVLERIDRDHRCLVRIRGHFFALKGHRAVDPSRPLGWNIRKPGARLRRAKVRGLYRVMKVVFWGCLAEETQESP